MAKSKFPKTLYLGIFLLVLGVICAALLSLMQMITEDKIAENEAATAEKANQEIAKFLEEDLSATNIVNITDNCDNLISERKNAVSSIFSLEIEGSNAYAFKVYEQNDFTEFYILVVLKEEGSDYSVARVKVLEDKGYLPTSLGASKNKAFYDETANNFGTIGSTSENVSKSFQVIASSTYSSKCVLKAITTSFAQLESMED